MSVLDQEHFKVVVFVGANQTKITLEVASVLQCMGSRAEYVRISGNGSNALDFHIAYYIGQFAAKEPDAYFHIISKDKGFDPLIEHLKAKKILASRSKDVSEIAVVKASSAKSHTDKVAIVISDLQRRGPARPRAMKTLSSTINSIFQKQLPEKEQASLIADLVAQGIVIVNGARVSYALP